MDEKSMEPCKVHWCKPRCKEHEMQLRSTSGDCLEEVGIPNRAKMVINHTIKPKIGDLVHCNNWMCTISGYIKQVKSFDGEEMVVTTRYKDHSKNFSFYVFEFYGVVEMVFDTMGNLVYKREGGE